jgi:hypothetical protein
MKTTIPKLRRIIRKNILESDIRTLTAADDDQPSKELVDTAMKIMRVLDEELHDSIDYLAITTGHSDGISIYYRSSTADWDDLNDADGLYGNKLGLTEDTEQTFKRIAGEFGITKRGLNGGLIFVQSDGHETLIEFSMVSQRIFGHPERFLKFERKPQPRSRRFY